MSDAAGRNERLFFQNDFSADELRMRRRRVMSAMKGGIAVIAGASEVSGFDPIRQSNDFYYLTGVEVPHAYLVMNADSGKSVLYLGARNDKHEKSDGPMLCAEDGDFVRERTGIEEVRPVSQIMLDVAGLRGDVWVMRAPAEGQRQCQDTLRHLARCILSDPLDGRPSREVQLMGRLAQLSPLAEFRDLSPIVHKLRLKKSPAEAEVMRRAGRLTALACKAAMAATKPGMFEFQLAAMANYLFEINGAQGSGYRPIIAGGKNIWMMHYWRNNARLQGGDLVIFDYAPDYNNYTSDIGRMWPVNGRYSPVQRELYGFVLEHHRVLLSLIRPGRTKDEILKDVAGRMRRTLEKTTWSKPIYRAAAENLLNSPRPLSHAVGMAVHEGAEWSNEPIEPGLVFAVDPEIFVPEEETYIRVEDTVLVTESGVEVLTADCPREMDEVETLLAGGGGMLDGFPAMNVNAGR